MGPVLGFAKSGLCLVVPAVLVLGGAVNFWTLLALALAVLWLQANAIACAGLHALRQEARVRWEALLELERRLLELRAVGLGGDPAQIQRWKSVLEKTIRPEDAAGVRAFFEEQQLAADPSNRERFGVLELRCREALRRYAEAASLYNERLALRWGWPLAKWMGFLPVEAPPRLLGLN
jgi:hypothetical protein